MSKSRLQIVAPVYNEEANLRELVRSLAEALRNEDDLDWSVLFVDDGSADRSIAVILMDADLQHPPAAIPEFLKRWRDGARAGIRLPRQLRLLRLLGFRRRALCA